VSIQVSIGPIVLRTVGDQYAEPCRLAGLLWEGSTTAADRVEVRCRSTNALLCALRTPDTNTLLGLTFPGKGIAAPFGFKLTTAPANQTIQVYLMEL
jgi:hypothetical protein